MAPNAPAGIIAFYRLFFATVIMLPFILFKYRDELKVVSRRDWMLASISGVFLALHFILWFESLQYTSVASSVVLVTLQPIFAFIGTYLLDRKSTRLNSSHVKISFSVFFLKKKKIVLFG